jgi:predicted ATPase
MSELINTFVARGDLAHLALLLWAAAASFALWFALRELAAASRRFDDFVRELQSFNRRCDHRLGRVPCEDTER